MELFGIEILTFVVLTDECDECSVMTERNSGSDKLEVAYKSVVGVVILRRIQPTAALPAPHLTRKRQLAAAYSGEISILRLRLAPWYGHIRKMATAVWRLRTIPFSFTV